MMGAGLLAPASSSWRGLATVEDSTMESIHTLRCGFLCLEDTEQANQVEVSQPTLLRLIYACAPLIDGLGHATRSATVPVCRCRFSKIAVLFSTAKTVGIARNSLLHGIVK